MPEPVPHEIFVGPRPAAELVDAVRSAGGWLADSAAEASAVVWFGGSPADFAAVAHPGTRWVQQPSAGVEPWLDAGLVNGDRVFSSAAGSYATAVLLPELAKRVRDNTERFLAGRPLVGVIDPVAGY